MRDPLVGAGIVLVIAGDEKDAVGRAQVAERLHQRAELFHRPVHQVAGDDDEVGSKLFEELLNFRRANFVRLMQGNFCGQCDFFHWRKENLLPATARAVRLRDNSQDSEIGLCQQTFQSWDGKLWRAAKDKAHGFTLP